MQGMDEERKRTVALCATILAARKIHEYEYRSCPAVEAAIYDAVLTANKILTAVDRIWPTVKRDGDS
jgi:hypothetical protein